MSFSGHVRDTLTVQRHVFGSTPKAPTGIEPVYTALQALRLDALGSVEPRRRAVSGSDDGRSAASGDTTRDTKLCQQLGRPHEPS